MSTPETMRPRGSSIEWFGGIEQMASVGQRRSAVENVAFYFKTVEFF